MKTILALMLISVIGIVVCFIGYHIITKKIIREQEKEIAKLKAENSKLRGFIHNTTVKVPRVIEIHDHRIAPENVPTFGDN